MLIGVDIDGLLAALNRKDEALFLRLSNLSPDEFWREWQKVYPEDFPEGGMSPVDATSIKARE